MEYRKQISAMKDESKSNVARIAYQLFLKNGVENVTLNDVAKEAGIAATTLYRYFGDKQHLLLECGLLYWNESLQFNSPSCEPGYSELTGFDQFKALYSTFSRAFSDYSPHLRFLEDFDYYVKKTLLPADTMTSYEQALQGWYQSSKSAFEKGLADKTIRPGIDFDIFYFTSTRLLLSFIVRMASPSNLVPGDAIVPVNTQVETAIDMVLSYIRA